MKCLNCQTDNPDNAKFCKGCGQALQTEVICDHCQYQILCSVRATSKHGVPAAHDCHPNIT
jgi:DNA-directed RNA polymerase subunit RPC12/RpoP